MQTTRQRFAATSSYDDRQRQGRPRKASKCDDREIVRMSLQNRRANSTQRNYTEWNGVRGTNRNPSTIRRRLLEVGLCRCVAKKKPLISKLNKKKPLRFAREHVHWGEKELAKLLYSDKSTFELFPAKGRVWVRRRPNERFKEECLVPTVKHGGGSIMIWGCFSLSGVGHICRVEGSINSSRYQNILKTYMLPSCTKDVIFQQDNAPLHTSRSTETWFHKRKIKLMDWPPQSPDLNPIETLWKKTEDEMTGHKITQ